MNKENKVDWSNIDGALHKPKRLHLEKDETDSLYHCPIQVCDHKGFQSQRGCRKHVYSKHSWFFYFDGKPELKHQQKSLQVSPTNVSVTTTSDCASTESTRMHAAKLFPSFSINLWKNWPRFRQLVDWKWGWLQERSHSSTNSKEKL